MITAAMIKNLKRDVDDEAYDIQIDKDGQWWHEGAPIKRLSLCKLFATVLYLDDNEDYWLITPAEKGRIKVEDVPFVIIDFNYQNNALKVFSNLGHEVIVSKEHPVILKNNLPYVVIRDNLLARINRAVYYDLVNLAQEKPGALYIESTGSKYCLGKI